MKNDHFGLWRLGHINNVHIKTSARTSPTWDLFMYVPVFLVSSLSIYYFTFCIHNQMILSHICMVIMILFQNIILRWLVQSIWSVT